MHEEYAKVIRMLMVACAISATLSGAALIVLLFGSSAEKFTSIERVGLLLVFGGGFAAFCIAGFCSDILRGMRRRGMIN